MTQRFEVLERKMILCLRGVVAHKYTVDEMTDAMWRIVNAGADETEKDRVMAVLLTNYGFGFPNESDRRDYPFGRGIGEKKFLMIVHELEDRANEFARNLLRENRHPIVAARKLRRFLNSFEDDEERMAVLYVVLQSNFTPYARIPKEFEGELVLPDPELYSDPRVRESIALIQRMYADGDQLEKADIFTFMWRILERHTKPTEKILVLGHIMGRYGDYVIDNAEEGCESTDPDTGEDCEECAQEPDRGGSSDPVATTSPPQRKRFMN